MICIDARLIYAPGIGTYLKNLLSQMKQTPWKWFALIHKQQASKLSEWPWIEPIVFGSSIYSLKEQFEYVLKIPRVDLFWSPHYNVPCLPIRARRRLVTIHDVFHLAHASALKPAEKLYAKLMMQGAMRLSDRVITGSIFSKEEIAKYTKINASDLSVIPYGVNPEIFYPDTGKKDTIIAKYGIQRPFILYVGSLKTHKNLKGLIKTFSLLVDRGYDDLDLVIVGGKSDVKQLCIAHPQIQNKLRFVGHVSDEELPFFYRRAKLFVFPSFYEGFGFPPLEAMSSGCPTVVARAGAMPEVCGGGALYVDPHSPENMASAIEDLLQSEEMCKELSLRGLERSRHFCWKRCVEAHCKVIESLIL